MAEGLVEAVSFPPSPLVPGKLTPPLLGTTRRMVLRRRALRFRTYTVQGARQEPERTGFICLFKNRISFLYTNMNIFTQNIHTRVPCLQVPHPKSWAGWRAGDESLSFGPEIQQSSG